MSIAASAALLDQVFAAEIYPRQPFKNPEWVGLALDRDKYDHTRMPHNYLETFLNLSGQASSSKAVIRGFGQFFSKSVSEPGLVSLNLDVHTYMRIVSTPESYSPEYQIVEATGAWGIWLHWDWSILGGPSALMSKVVDGLGGKDELWTRTVNEFGLNEEPVDPTLVKYLKTLTQLGGSAA
jgi:hypothetical protein